MRSAPARSGAAAQAFEVLCLLLAVAFSTWVRVDTALADSSFAGADPAGLLKSDPGLLYYLTERVAEAPGLVPADWRADPRIAYPDTVDVPADYTVGLEFLLGKTWKLLGAGVPLTTWCLFGSALLAALTTIGVWGLARELCGSARWAAAATALYLCLPASYRTIGFLLIREDLSLPLFALHLWLAARAWRLGSVQSHVLSGLALGLALATWHAMSFVVAIEVLALYLVFLWTGRQPLHGPGLWQLFIPMACMLLIPALGGGLALTPLLCLSMYLSPRFSSERPRTTGLIVLVLGLLVLFLRGSGSDASGDMDHVIEVMLAKLRYLGELPADASALTFDARMLWQGPFAGMPAAQALAIFGAALLLGLPSLVSVFFSRGASESTRALAFFTAGSLCAAWLVGRMSTVPAMTLPVLVVWSARRLCLRLRDAQPREPAPGGQRSLAELGWRVVPALLLCAALAQAWSFSSWKSAHLLRWYRPTHRQQEIATLVRNLPQHVPEGQAVAADFMISTAILAQTGRPIILQPKWERKPARERVERFWQAFYHKSPAALRSMLLEDYQCRYLLVDRATLWLMTASRYAAGLAGESAPPPGSAAQVLLSQDEQVLRTIPGYRLLWRSPSSLIRSDGSGAPSDYFRLFELTE